MLDPPQLAGRDEVRHQHERDRLAVEDAVVLVQPRLELGLEPRAGVTELRELHEVLQLEVVDVLDQGASGPIDWGALLSMRGYRRHGGRCPEWDSNPHLIDFESTLSASWSTRAPPHSV